MYYTVRWSIVHRLHSAHQLTNTVWLQVSPNDLPNLLRRQEHQLVSACTVFLSFTYLCCTFRTDLFLSHSCPRYPLQRASECVLQISSSGTLVVYISMKRSVWQVMGVALLKLHRAGEAEQLWQAVHYTL